MVAFEKTGFVPRSIPRTFIRFIQELFPSTEKEVIAEFRLSRYQALTAVKYLLQLIFIPYFLGWLAEIFIIHPTIESLWNRFHPEIFLNISQQQEACAELDALEEQIYFDTLLGEVVNLDLQLQARSLAEFYNKESITSITNLFTDSFRIIFFFTLCNVQKRQIAVLKSFVDELLYRLSDTTKAFCIILITDIFVGFHSPHGWEVVLSSWIHHLGFPDSSSFVMLFVATFPVILDTAFKYWIFRYLNQIAPSAVATFHNMNE